MASLLIRCPVRPVKVSPEGWSSEDLYFSWAFINDPAFHAVLDLDACPVADEVIATIPGIDVRLIELKTPSVSNKKISQLLPMMLEDELLSSVAATSIQLLPPFANQMPDKRLVSIVERDWLLWLSKKLAVLNCERIQLIPESLLLPTHASTVYYEPKDEAIFYSLKKSFHEIVCWSQPASEKAIVLNASEERSDFKELSLDLLLTGLETEKKIYQYIDLLPAEFSAFRKNTHSELQHWFSKELWKPPLKWVGYLTATLIVSYSFYLGFLIWQDLQWQKILQKTMQQVLVHENINQPSFPLLVESSCLAAHKNHETCEGDFERMLMALHEVLGGIPAGALRNIEYSKKGLVFELKESALTESQQLVFASNASLESVGAAQYLLKPYANLSDE